MGKGTCDLTPARQEGPQLGVCTESPVFSSSAGAGAAGGGAGGDDPATSVAVHTAAARDRHVQPKREFPAFAPRLAGQIAPEGHMIRS